jgi:hypothetical protein
MMKNFIPFVISIIFLYGCKDDAIITDPPVTNYDLKHIMDISYSNIDISLFNNEYDSLTTGYNELFLKIKKNGIEQNTGTLDFFPKMWMTPTYMHSTAVQNEFLYDNASGYFRGYVIFNMPTSPPDVVWYGVFNFTDGSNNQTISDSIPMYVIYDRDKQWRFFFDSTDQSTWMLSLYKPYRMKKGLNNVNIVLHKTNEFLIEHEQITNAQMSVSVYTAGANPQYSSGNISPVIGSDGIYHGKLNFPEFNNWIMCDTIWHNGRIITGSPPPFPTFYFSVTN